MRRLFFLLALLPAIALAQGYQPVRANCPSCVLTAQSLTLSGSLSASTVIASTSVQTPDIKGAGGSDRILLPTGDVTTIKGGTNTANYVTVTGAASGTSPIIAAAGSDANRGIDLRGQGSGGVNLAANQANFVQVLSNTTGGAPLVQATGSDTNIDLKLGGKGTGGEQLVGKVTKYNGVSTAGLGVSPIYAYGSVSTSTSATTITTYTPAAQGVFEIGGSVAVTAWTSGNVSLNVAYTDCQGNSRNYALWGTNQGGSNNNVLTGVGNLNLYSTTICANAAAISLLASIPGNAATVTDYGFIRQVN